MTEIQIKRRWVFDAAMWQSVYDELGRLYYWNILTDETKWILLELPLADSSTQSSNNKKKEFEQILNEHSMFKKRKAQQYLEHSIHTMT